MSYLSDDALRAVDKQNMLVAEGYMRQIAELFAEPLQSKFKAHIGCTRWFVFGREASINCALHDAEVLPPLSEFWEKYPETEPQMLEDGMALVVEAMSKLE